MDCAGLTIRSPAAVIMSGRVRAREAPVAVNVAIPDFGPGFTSGFVAEWYVADGARVDTGEPVCRVENAFLAVELEASGPGVLRHRTAAGEHQPPEAVLAVILAPGEVPAGTPAPPAPEVALAASSAECASNSNDAAEEVSLPPAPPEPIAEIEEALVEAVVVPFPRQFAGTPGRAWDAVPGDAVEFDTSLFGEGDHDRTKALVEPGGSIPGLPLWEPEDAITPGGTPDSGFTRILKETVANAQVLTMTMAVNLTEADRMRGAFAREWGEDGPAPLLEDVVFRAIAWALEDTPFAGGTGAMLVATTSCDLAFAVREPASRSFREGVAAREAVGDEAFESAAWLFVSLAALGVTSASPRLEPGRHMSFALGAQDASNRAALKIAYDSSQWSEGSAARLLARVRDILDLPYAMLT